MTDTAPDVGTFPKTDAETTTPEKVSGFESVEPTRENRVLAKRRDIPAPAPHFPIVDDEEIHCVATPDEPPVQILLLVLLPPTEPANASSVTEIAAVGGKFKVIAALTATALLVSNLVREATAGERTVAATVDWARETEVPLIVMADSEIQVLASADDPLRKEPTVIPKMRDNLPTATPKIVALTAPVSGELEATSDETRTASKDRTPARVPSNRAVVTEIDRETADPVDTFKAVAVEETHLWPDTTDPNTRARHEERW